MINQMVLSSEIEWVGYEPKRNMLQVEFIEGPIYQYQDVPREIFNAFLSATSHGRYFEQFVKGHYPYRRVR